MKDLREILKLADVSDSTIDTGSEWVRLIEFHGVQYGLLSDDEQQALDRGIMALVSGLDFTVKLWATNRPLEIRPEIARMEEMAAAWKASARCSGVAVVCRGMATTLRAWTAAQIPERRLFVAVSVVKMHGLEELDRRVDQVTNALRNAIKDADPHVLDAGELLQALHGFWQKGRHIRTRADTLGLNKETVLMVEGGDNDAVATSEVRLG